MSDDKFDAIVVGAGVAGSVAALVMARAGLDVLVIERGDSAGCKNMTGGRLYAHTLEAIIDFPLAFTEDLQPGGINYQVCDFTPGGRFETDINRLCPPADTAVIRAA